MVYESPVHCGECTKHEGSYDLTATYTQDSDFTSIYWTNAGLYWSDKTRSESPKTDIHQSKTRFAAALVSNCRPDRLSYLRHLQQFISLDIFGACGSHACPDSGDCRAYIADSYKFFFAIENSICTGYVKYK
jgi:glycoprotein 3-alpha-L-fucosyltransferase